ncbi:MAG: cupredoxin domain-containing protein [Acidimicrobiales bacterium]
MRKILLIGAALVLVTVACGDDDDGGGSGEAPVELEGTVNDEGSGEVSDGEVEMELDDFYFGPTFTQAEAGSTVTVSLFNEGDTTHTFTIDSLGIDEELAPEATLEVEVTLPESGAVRYYCRFHADQGMQGAFYANAGDAVED